MKIFGILASVAVAAAVSAVGMAQAPAPRPYYLVNCVKVKPDKGPEFDKWAADSLHKVAQARIDSGTITTWLLLRAVLPAGKDNECDYQTVSFYPGIPSKPLEAAELDDLMKKAGLTTEQYRQSRNASSELATSGMYQMVVNTGSVEKGDYVVLGYLKVKEPAIVNEQKWIDFETKAWKPISELLIEKGITRGWSVDARMLPDGAALPFDGLTVDVYPSWEAIFKLQDDPNFPEYWKKVHPDMDFEATFEEYEKYRTVVREELWVVQDMIAAKPAAGHK
ncbi:MAG TPA: hypothetical protein VKR52_20735 [Terracidiphilus sp.]|nr:hypothetical protein [Terracidiphilus sp.]